MKRLLILLTISTGTLAQAGALTGEKIQGFVGAAIKPGEGEAVLPPVTHPITWGQMVESAKELRIQGADLERTILQLPWQNASETEKDVISGKPWIFAQKDPKLCAALTWLMENPWAGAQSRSPRRFREHLPKAM